MREIRQGPGEEVGHLSSAVWQNLPLSPFLLSSPFLFSSLPFSPSPSPPVDLSAISLNKKLIMGKACSWSLG